MMSVPHALYNIIIVRLIVLMLIVDINNIIIKLRIRDAGRGQTVDPQICPAGFGTILFLIRFIIKTCANEYHKHNSFLLLFNRKLW